MSLWAAVPKSAAGVEPRTFFSLFYLAASCIGIFVSHRQIGALAVPDDAYYYFIIAQNILDRGISSFDGQSLTNGYHPLWIAVLLLQYLVFGSSVYVTAVVGALMMAAALHLFLALIEPEDSLLCGAFTLCYIIVSPAFNFIGMETSLWVLCLAVLVSITARTDIRAPGHAIVTGMAAAACIGARIDSAFFVLPLVWLSLPARQQRLLAATVIAGLAVTYLAVNQAIFGIPLPISGAVKSLGGFQLNEVLVTQLHHRWSHDGWWPSALAFLRDGFARSLLLLSLSPLFIVITPPNSLARRLAIAYAVGFVLFAGKLFFLSSWKIWGWYNYPIVLGTLAAFHALYPHVWAILSRPRWAPRRMFVAVIAALLVTKVWADNRAYSVPGFDRLNRLAVARFGAILNGDRVAMGDRAGSFAAEYKGPVTQLEGLANDKEYFDVIASRGDLRALLCKRGVKYLVDYEVDLKDYAHHEVRVLRGYQTQFQGPTVAVSRRQEVAKLFDLTIYDNSARDEGDNYLYIWRLEGCDDHTASVR